MNLKVQILNEAEDWYLEVNREEKAWLKKGQLTVYWSCPHCLDSWSYLSLLLCLFLSAFK